MNLIESLRADLAEVDRQALRRRRRRVTTPTQPLTQVDGRDVLAFCSNDYLGLAAHPALVAALQDGAARWGCGSGASHHVSGHQAPHEDLEAALAAHVGAAAAVGFATGYMANLGVVPALVGRGDAVFADRLNHASLIDAVRLSGADSHRYAHNDVAALAAQLARSSARRKLIVTDAVFSMDGDLAPLAAITALAEQHDAWLVVDDAHGFGVLGPRGAGSLAHLGIPWSPRIVLIGTLGKAAGVAGAFAAGDAEVIDWLVQKARTQLFTTAAPAPLACALLASLALLRGPDGEARRRTLAAHIAQLRRRLTGLPWPLLPSDTAIQPLIVGDNQPALDLSAQLLERGLWVPAIRPPTVPAGQARLRITLSAAHTTADIDRLADALTALAPA